MKKLSVLLFVITFISYEASAQLNLPPSSPDAELKQQVGFTNIVVKYARPGAKGRKIFGGLVPYGELWRTGASDATTIHFSDTVHLNKNLIPSGTYSLFTIPNPEEWTIIINRDTAMHGASNYSKDQDLIRFTITPDKAPRFYETFTIEVTDIIKDAATIDILWENTQVKLNLKTNADEKVLAEIKNRIFVKKEEKSSLYYQASLYYFNNNKDPVQALEWIKTANKKGDDGGYLQLQAKIEAGLGNYSTAIKTAEASSQLAKTKKLDQIVTANEKLITEWKNKLIKK
jgi:hypothetical protein